MKSIKWILFGLVLILFGAVSIAIEELFMLDGGFRGLGVMCPIIGLVISIIGACISSKS